MKTLGSAAALVLIGLLLLAGKAGAQTESNLYCFGTTPNDGIGPFAGLVQSSDGNFYGTTIRGGTNGFGTVFRITSSGTLATLWSFSNGVDGANSYAALVQGRDGNFYGTTSGSGSGPSPNGTVFRITPSGSLTNLHTFTGYPYDGDQPLAGPVQGSDGNLYGTTFYGGTSTNCGSLGCGTLFRISASGTYTNLYSFGSNPNDGFSPQAGLVQGSDGSFYGTTVQGGNGPCVEGCGTVFRLSPSGTYTNLYSFAGSPNDGQLPYAVPVQGSDGNFYGATTLGGTHNNGTIFRISPSGNETNLYSFAGSADYPNAGSQPFAGLVQGSDGNFYGTTYNGGMYGYGAVFRISPSGSYASLYSFPSSPDGGANPQAALVQGSDGSFYGTTTEGGTTNDGVVFKLTVPLNPPANQISAIQPVGNDMAVSVPSVAGETYRLQFSSSLAAANWVNVAGVSVTNCIGSLLTLTNSGGALLRQGFYRFDITP